MSNRSLLLLATLAISCSDDGASAPVDVQHRAYVLSHGSPELTVIDLGTLDVIARVDTHGRGNHMVEVSKDMAKVYVTSSESDEVVVVDARTLTVEKRVQVGKHPTHLAADRSGKYMWVLVEGDEAVTAIDTASDEVHGSITGFHTPHNIRFDADGETAYVANAAAHHLSIVDLPSMRITGAVSLDGFAVPTSADNEGGFHDAQIDGKGVLYAAHMNSGKVLVYDTQARQKRADLTVGPRPWSVFAEHPFTGVPLRHIVPSFGDSTLAVIDGEGEKVMKTFAGDSESYGVNFTPLAPDRAYVMNRVRRDIAVIDTASGAEIDHVIVGGTTETASTSADGKYIVATVSSANRVVVLDAATGQIARVLEDVGVSPWAVTIPGGQNYCH